MAYHPSIKIKACELSEQGYTYHKIRELLAKEFDLFKPPAISAIHSWIKIKPENIKAHRKEMIHDKYERKEEQRKPLVVVDNTQQQNQHDFNFNNMPVRTLVIDDKPWFVAKDVCEVLEISDHLSSIRNFQENQKGVHSIHTLGGKQEMIIVSESGLYKLIFKSRKPEAEKFQDWVTEDVLPSIRKTGKYSISNHMNLSRKDLALMVIQSEDEREKLKQSNEHKDQQIEAIAQICTRKDQQIEAIEDYIIQADNEYLIRQFAKSAYIHTLDGRFISQNEMFQLFKQKGWLLKTQKNEFSSKEIATGRARMKMVNIVKERNDGTLKEINEPTPVITARGFVYYHKKLLDDGFYSSVNPIINGTQQKKLSLIEPAAANLAQLNLDLPQHSNNLDYLR